VAASRLDQLRTFATVFRVGSITEASRLLGISQPTASAHIASLEQSLGYALFSRDSRGVTATPRASELYRETGSHIDALDDILTLGAVGEGMLHLGGPTEFLHHAVLPRLAEFGTPVAVSFGLADDLLERLRAGSLDVVMSAIRPRVQGVSATALFDEEFVVIAAPSWAEHPIDDVPVVAYADNLPIVRRYWRSVFDRRPDLTVAAIVPDLRGVLAAVQSGMGMSVLPTYLVTSALESGVVVELHRPEVPPLNTVYVATRTGELERSARLRAARDTLQRMTSEI